MKDVISEGLSAQESDPLIRALHGVIRIAVKALAVLMALVILWGVADVGWLMYQKIVEPPFIHLTINDILTLFGSFLVILIAIEIFFNITLYLRSDVIHVKLVVATALMAIARKVIVFDFQTLESHYVWATGSVVLALGITYWLVARGQGDDMASVCITDQPQGHPSESGPGRPAGPADESSARSTA